MYETRDGMLRVTDDAGPDEGEPLILGRNILQFSAEQSEDSSKQRITVKGQRTKKDVRGAAAVLSSVKEIKDATMQTDIPSTVQAYGDGTPEALERRARFEHNKRSSASKKVTIEVFHVQTTSGEPWDVGVLHYIEIPPEGIYDIFECTSLTYTVQNDTTLKTTLELSPPPAKGATGSQTGALDSLPSLNEQSQVGHSRRLAAGVTFAPGMYPQPWSGPVLSVVTALPIAAVASKLFQAVDRGTEKQVNKPPNKLPPNFKSKQGQGRGTK